MVKMKTMDGNTAAAYIPTHLPMLLQFILYSVLTDG